MADEEDEEVPPYTYEGERKDGEEVELSVTVEVDEKPRTKTSTVKLLGPREGKGRAAYTNGDTYEGGYANGARHGEGKYVYKAKGWTYEGGFAAGLRHGLGVMHYGNGERYHGFWREGLKSGQGTMYFASRDIYTGEWLGAHAVHLRGGSWRAETASLRSPLLPRARRTAHALRLRLAPRSPSTHRAAPRRRQEARFRRLLLSRDGR